MHIVNFTMPFAAATPPPNGVELAMAATNFLGRLLPRLATPIGDFSSCHVRRVQSRNIDTHAIQKDRSGQEELSIYHHDHQYLICNFGNPKKNRDHNQQDLSGFGLPCS